MNLIKLYKASSFKYTPFDDFQQGDLDYLKLNNIVIVNKVEDANVIISQNFKFLIKHFWRIFFNMRFLIWTLEPRFDTHFVSSKKYFLGLFKCYFMNIYTKDVFVTNISVHCRKINKTLHFLSDDFLLESKKIVALMSYYKGLESRSLIFNGKNIDLIALRTKIALEGNEINVIDVYGKGWPKGVSIEDSREGEWENSKGKILEKYNFNLCFENTAAYNYMTEKIWDSIQNYCLPIYYSKNTNAYEIFPKESFIDYADFNSPAELFNFINSMSTEEFIIRLNRCVQVYNTISEKGISLVKSERKKTLDKIVEKIRHISVS